MTPEDKILQIHRGSGPFDHHCFSIWASKMREGHFCVAKTPELRLGNKGFPYNYLYASREQIIALLHMQSFNHELFETFEVIVGDAQQTDEQIMDMALACCNR